MKSWRPVQRRKRRRDESGKTLKILQVETVTLTEEIGFASKSQHGGEKRDDGYRSEVVDQAAGAPRGKRPGGGSLRSAHPLRRHDSPHGRPLLRPLLLVREAEDPGLQSPAWNQHLKGGSLLEAAGPEAPPVDWVEWFLQRVQREPWALGGAVVIGVFVLGTLSIALFAVLYGCCCCRRLEGREQNKKKKKKKKTSRDVVI